MECVLKPEMFGALDARVKDTLNAQSLATNAVMNHLMEKISDNKVHIKKNGMVVITMKYKKISSFYLKNNGVWIHRTCKNVKEKFNNSVGTNGWEIVYIDYGVLSTIGYFLYGIGMFLAVVPGIMVLNNKMKVIFYLKKT